MYIENDGMTDKNSFYPAKESSTYKSNFFMRWKMNVDSLFLVLAKHKKKIQKNSIKIINFPCSIQNYANPPVRDCQRTFSPPPAFHAD